MRKILRRAADRDVDIMALNKAREAEAVIRARAIAKQLNLEMKISEVEFQADGRKATFFYIADDRVDFRELIKIYAKEFRVKVEMRQIGARQEAGKIGGIGSCGQRTLLQHMAYRFQICKYNCGKISESFYQSK